MPAPVLVLPGLGNSGPLHWQSIWEQAHPEFVRVQQRDWDNPVCPEWVAAIEAAVQRAGPDVVLVAHSLACLAVAHWSASPHSPIKAALLVAVPDPDCPEYPGHLLGFSKPPTEQFTFPAVAVVSADDPYSTPEHAEQLAAAWGCRVVRVGAYGHINASSGLGAWAEGYALLDHLRS